MENGGRELEERDMREACLSHASKEKTDVKQSID